MPAARARRWALNTTNLQQNSGRVHESCIAVDGGHTTAVTDRLIGNYDRGKAIALMLTVLAFPPPGIPSRMITITASTVTKRLE
ncbi:hypothetical protein J6590_005246 [Homalodisca vitripennis]|nr:hypothetical protein J6590_005246 [Homalodisca vitripennis]